MDCENKLWLVALFLFSSAMHCVVGVPQVPCLFIFGDSLSDNGNNLNLNTDAKVNYKPYGIDFPSGPTGRFTNGKTSVDILTDILGFDHYIPAHANINGTNFVEGVNYASGAAGIRNETGTHLGIDISMGMQLEHHKDIVSQISKKLGKDKVQQHLNKCLYYVNIGSNDYLNNYFLPKQYPSNGKYNADQYAAALVQEHSTYLKALYDLGARKFSLIGLGLIGCVPHEINRHGKNGSECVEEESKAALLFNDKLKALVDRYNKELPNAKFIFINTGIMKGDSMKLDKANLTCCKVGSNGQCIPNQEPCKDRNTRPFFDEFHPTEMVNKASAYMAYNSPLPAFAYPMDISHLVKL
ncbi:GDSL esterase/lipase At1g29670-like [Vicia villosa]|uniref:GDSL esterase/lipase At1g29670-like n=1 Tax=Vicia villosa TaxID=3911 RepID=UPI00273C8086|nr:GDSL esterase/lipase At1g29670-like [Vicia villosa]